MGNVTINTEGLSEFILTILSTICFCYVAYRMGYDARSKELETDFDFEKEKEEIK